MSQTASSTTIPTNNNEESQPEQLPTTTTETEEKSVVDFAATCGDYNYFWSPHPDTLNSPEEVKCQEFTEEASCHNNLAFNLYQRQIQICSEVKHIPSPIPVHSHHSDPMIPSPLELQGHIYFNLDTGLNTFTPQSPVIQLIPHPLRLQPQHSPQFQNNHYPPPQFNVIMPQPVIYNYSDQDDPETPPFCESNSDEENKFKEEEEQTLLQIKIPSWAKLNLDEEENTRVYPLSSSSRTSSRPRLVEYIGDQYHEKNPHTRRTILLNQKRSSENDPIVFYRFYQFSCVCMGKVWFSPLHRAREGCYCRDCHQFVKPFGHIDGLTPYMGHEICYAKFQCHNCARSWSCQKSKSNFPDNCFSCGTIVYPYYQVSHSVLRRKITRQSDNSTVRFRNMTYSETSSDSVDEEEDYQFLEPGSNYFHQFGSPSSESKQLLFTSTPSPPSFPREVWSATTANSSSPATTPEKVASTKKIKLGQSMSDTVLLGNHHHHWNKYLSHHQHRK